MFPYVSKSETNKHKSAVKQLSKHNYKELAKTSESGCVFRKRRNSTRSEPLAAAALSLVELCKQIDRTAYWEGAPSHSTGPVPRNASSKAWRHVHRPWRSYDNLQPLGLTDSLWSLRFSRRWRHCGWCPGLWRHTDAEISEKRIVSIFNPEDGDSKLLQNVAIHLWIYTALQHTGTTPLICLHGIFRLYCDDLLGAWDRSHSHIRRKFRESC